MSWVDQCKQAFKTKAEGEYYKDRTNKNFIKLIRIMSKESNMPARVLLEWWKELEGKKKDKDYIIPKCRCGKNVMISPSTGKPLKEDSIAYGVCVECGKLLYKTSGRIKRGKTWTLTKS